MLDVLASIVQVVLLVGGAVALVGFGVWLAYDEVRESRTQLDEQRRALDAEWQALHQARRIGDVFYAARSALSREAMRRQPPRR